MLERACRHAAFALLAAAVAALMIVDAGAVTRVPSADGQFWDIQDTPRGRKTAGASPPEDARIHSTGSAT